MKENRNMIKCRLCNDVISSRHRHDFVECECGNVYVDGGDAYFKFGWGTMDFEIWNVDYQQWVDAKEILK